MEKTIFELSVEYWLSRGLCLESAITMSKDTFDHKGDFIVDGATGPIQPELLEEKEAYYRWRG